MTIAEYDRQTDDAAQERYLSEWRRRKQETAFFKRLLGLVSGRRPMKSL